MEMGRKLVLVLVVLMVAVFEESRALSLCNMSFLVVWDCKRSVTLPFPIPPSSSCCQALSEVDLACMCSYKNSLVLFLLAIDSHLVAALPAKCGLTPPADC